MSPGAGNFNRHSIPGQGDNSIWVNHRVVDLPSVNSSYSVLTNCFHVGNKDSVLPEFMKNG